jgi:phosphoglycolate phosphatase
MAMTQKEKARFKAVVFDLDGTLLDTLDDLADCMNAALRELGLKDHPDVSHHKYFVGDGVRNYILRVLPEDKRADEELIARLSATYRRNYAAGWKVKTRPYDGVPQTLAELRRRGLRLAVLSNKPDEFSKATVAAFFEPGLFELVVGAGDDMPLKPDPAAALEIARRMGLAPADFLYVGDTATDMKTAVAAGMFPVGAMWGFRPAEELKGSGARVLIKRPGELSRYV